MGQIRHALMGAGLGLLLVGVMTGCATTAAPGAFQPPGQPAALTEYTVQPGDTLAIRFYYHPDHDQEAIVRTDGKLMLSKIGETQAAGLTPTKLAEQIARRYSANLRNPEVSVTVKAVNQGRIYVGGEVNRPGFVQYRPGLTAVQAILEAGGPKDTGRLTETVLLQHVGDNGYQASKVNLGKVFEEGDTRSDLPLGASDVLFVPKTAIAKLNLFVEQYIFKMLPFRPGFAATVPVQ